MAQINYISILNSRVGYLLYLPEVCSEEQVNYLENVLPFYKEEEKNKVLVTELLEEELARQKEIIESKKK